MTLKSIERTKVWAHRADTSFTSNCDCRDLLVDSCHLHQSLPDALFVFLWVLDFVLVFLSSSVWFFFTRLIKGSSSELSFVSSAKQQSQYWGFNLMYWWQNPMFSSCYKCCHSTSSLFGGSTSRCSCLLCVFLHWFLRIGFKVRQGLVVIVRVAV